MATRLIFSAAVALTGCTMSEGATLATTDRDRYPRDPTSNLASVEITLHNGTDAAIATEGCAPTIPLGYVLERENAGNWEWQQSNLICITPFIGVTVPPGGKRSATLACCGEPGRFRLWIWYHPVGDARNWDSVGTAPFAVQ